MLIILNKELIKVSAESGALYFGDNLMLPNGEKTPFIYDGSMLNSGASIYHAGKSLAEIVYKNAPGSHFITGPSINGIALATATAIALWNEYGINMRFILERKDKPSKSPHKFVKNSAFSGEEIYIYGKTIAQDLVEENDKKDLIKQFTPVLISPRYISAPLAVAGSIALFLEKEIDAGYAYARIKNNPDEVDQKHDYFGKEVNASSFYPVFVYALNHLGKNSEFQDKSSSFQKQILSLLNNEACINLVYALSHNVKDSFSLKNKKAFVVQDFYSYQEEELMLMNALRFSESKIEGMGLLFDCQLNDCSGKDPLLEFSKKVNSPIYSAMSIVSIMNYLYNNKIYVDAKFGGTNEIIKRLVDKFVLGNFEKYITKHGTQSAIGEWNAINENNISGADSTDYLFKIQKKEEENFPFEP